MLAEILSRLYRGPSGTQASLNLGAHTAIIVDTRWDRCQGVRHCHFLFELELARSAERVQQRAQRQELVVSIGVAGDRILIGLNGTVLMFRANAPAGANLLDNCEIALPLRVRPKTFTQILIQGSASRRRHGAHHAAALAQQGSEIADSLRVVDEHAKLAPCRAGFLALECVEHHESTFAEFCCLCRCGSPGRRVLSTHVRQSSNAVAIRRPSQVANRENESERVAIAIPRSLGRFNNRYLDLSTRAIAKCTGKASPYTLPASRRTTNAHHLNVPWSSAGG